jgi:hypothetical protein
MLTKDYLFVAQVIDQEIQEVSLLVSNSSLKQYDFQAIETNTKSFNEHSYTFLDTTEKSAFLLINHFKENSKYGHVYISDIDGLRYSQSLRHNLRSLDNNQADFEKVKKNNFFILFNKFNF